MSRLRHGLLALTVVGSFAALVACAGSEPSPAVPPPTTATPSPSSSVIVTNSDPGAPAPPAAASAPAPPPAASALAAILTTDPTQLAAITSASASAAAAKTQPASTAPGMEQGLAAVALRSAPGMKPEGALAMGTLKEGDHISWSVTMAPGKCYAIVGYSPSGEVQDLDLHLLAPPFFTMMAGEDTTDDNTPVIGSGPNPMCPVVAVAIPYKLDITSQKGTGRAAVQLFSKSK